MNTLATRMHSSRMRTARLRIVPGCLGGRSMTFPSSGGGGGGGGPVQRGGGGGGRKVVVLSKRGVGGDVHSSHPS